MTRPESEGPISCPKVIPLGFDMSVSVFKKRKIPRGPSRDVRCVRDITTRLFARKAAREAGKYRAAQKHLNVAGMN